MDDLLRHAGASGEAVGGVLGEGLLQRSSRRASARVPLCVQTRRRTRPVVGLLRRRTRIRMRWLLHRNPGRRPTSGQSRRRTCRRHLRYRLTSMQRIDVLSLPCGAGCASTMPRLHLLHAITPSVFLGREMCVVEVGKGALLHVLVARLEDVFFLRPCTACARGFAAIC